MPRYKVTKSFIYNRRRWNVGEEIEIKNSRDRGVFLHLGRIKKAASKPAPVPDDVMIDWEMPEPEGEPEPLIMEEVEEKAEEEIPEKIEKPEPKKTIKRGRKGRLYKRRDMVAEDE